MAITERMRQRIEELACQLSVEMGEVDESEGDCWLDAIEDRAVELGDAIGSALVAQQAGRLPQPDLDAKCPDCDRPGRLIRERERTLIGRRGPTTITEPECYCPACRRAFFPSDPSDRG